MKTILLGIAAFLAALTPPFASAEEQEAEDKLLTRLFRITPSFLRAAEDTSGEWPLILDGLEDNQTTRTNNARKALEDIGVTFPPGAAAIYHAGAHLLAVKNTAANIRKTAKFVEKEQGIETGIFIEVRILEYLPDVETKLTGRSTYAELEAKLGESVKTVCAASALTKSGQRATVRVDSGMGKPAAAQSSSGKTKRVSEGNESWPPPAGIQRAILETEPTLAPVTTEEDEIATMQIDFRYAAPAGSGQPAMRMELHTNFTIADGHLLVLKTFTVNDPASKRTTPRRYAVVASFSKVNPEGKNTEKLRE